MSLKGKKYWKSLDQLAETKDFQEFLHREFPQGASEMTDTMSRRTFFTLMGASLALAGLTSCHRPEEKIIPYVKAPEDMVLGKPIHYATTMPFGTSSYGVVVKSNEGRPTKIEGNSKHPSTLGASNSFIQASILNLYDPDRAKKVLNNRAERDWATFVEFWREKYSKYFENGGEGLAVLSESFASPTLAGLKAQFVKTFPHATWTTFEPISNENVSSGVNQATGKSLLPVYHVEKAHIVLSLDADFMHLESDNITNAQGFAAGRNVKNTHTEMNRLYMVESSFSVTGSISDHRLRIKSSQVLDFALSVADELNRIGVNTGISVKPTTHFDGTFVKALAKDLVNNKGQSLIITSSQQSAELNALVLALNGALGNIDQTVSYVNTDFVEISDVNSLIELADKIKAGSVETLLMLGGNPVYNAPADLNFKKLLQNIETTIHLSAYENETGINATWLVPQSHYLESWSDARATDGTLSVIQPLIRPLFESKSAVEFLNVIVSGRDVAGYDIVREQWKKLIKGDFEVQWRKVLHDGILADSALPIQEVSVNSGIVNSGIEQQTEAPAEDKLELVFKLSPSTFDGRFANNGWMQELPHPATKLTWDNVACMSQKTADMFGVQNEEMIELSVGARKMEAVVWILPGQAENSISIDLGYGRTHAGRVGDSVGFNAYKLRTTKALNFATDVKVVKLNKKYKLANVQDHWSMEGRPLIREATLDEYKHHPKFAEEMVEHPPLENLWEAHSYEEGYQWGLDIDLNSCIGCNACTVACQSENNIPIVGKEQTRNGREMHWIRLDRYFNGDPENPEMVFQPMACQHCENAPCEQVCPVQATSHNKEGLNVMVYNRCVGTRYCSNNCPYKVRRFNFFNYVKDLPELVQMAQNPDVTVRTRGVMEKCTYCVQRINGARIQAKNEGREIKDGEVQTACQQACPTKAIRFGNINDPNSDIVKAKKNDRKYEVLAELNVRPRTSFAAKLRNPNPELVSSDKKEHNSHA